MSTKNLPGGWKEIGERAYRWDPQPDLTYFVTPVFEAGAGDPKRFLVFFSHDESPPQSINHEATSPQQGWEDCHFHFEKNFLADFEEAAQQAAKSEREKFEARTPRLWHWVRPRFKFTPHEEPADIRLGAVVQIDDGGVSEDCRAGQVWHRSLSVHLFLFWATIRIVITSPHGRLIAYHDSEIPTH